MERTIAVWFANGTPVRLVWEGQRLRVNDTPTPLSPADILWHPAITHPPAAHWRGWRFQAVDEAGRAGVFDIRRFEGQDNWRLIAVYDYALENRQGAVTRRAGR